MNFSKPLGWLGESHENVGWPSHLHFQIIRELDGREGDYPGVCRASEQATWLKRCPDPNLLLRIKLLSKLKRKPAQPRPKLAAKSAAAATPAKRSARPPCIVWAERLGLMPAP